MTSALSPKAEALLQAHVEHTIQQLQDFDVIRAEVAAFFQHISETPLSTTIPVELIQKIAKDRVLGVAPHNQLRTEVTNVIKDALKNPIGKQTIIADLIPDATADIVINMISNDTTRRNKLIHEIFSNPTTGEVLSSTISHAISDYMENNMVTKKIPGASSLMKFGKGMLEKATDSNLDDALQSYLARNIRNIMNVSEKKTQEQLSSKKINRIASDIWLKLKANYVANFTQLVDMPTIDAISHLVVVIWNHIRVEPYVQTLVNDGIVGWYERNSNRSLVEILADLNVTPDYIVAELEPSLAVTMKHLADNGYLRQRIEPLFRKFYASSVAQKIIAE